MTCSRFFAAIPTPGIFIAFAFGLVLGALARGAWDRRHIHTTAPSRDDTEEPMHERPLGMVWLESRPRLHALYFRYVPALVVLMAFSVIFSVTGVTWLTFQRGEDSARLTKANTSNAVVSCQNANESRQASLALWNFIIGISASSNPNATATDKANLAAILAWIGDIYRPRDCNDLSRKYPIPPPPTLGAH